MEVSKAMTARPLTLVLAALLSSACSEETVAPPPKPPTGALQAVAVVDAGPDTVTTLERALPERYAKAVSSPPPGGTAFADLAPLLNPDLSGFMFPGMPPAHETAGILRAHEKLFGAFDDRRVTLSRIWRTASEQTIEWTLTGTHAREWKGIAPTHKNVAFSGVTLLWTKDDGSITDIHVYFDVAVVMAQLGAAPKELPKEVQALAPPAPPSGPPQVFEQTQAAADEEKRNEAAVRSALDALENNEAAYVGAFADDVEIASAARPAPARGKAEMKAYYRAMHKAIGQLDTSAMGAWGVGKFAIVEYSINGEQLGPIGWIPAKRDNVVRFQVVDVCEMRDGKIARVWRYDNPAEMLGGDAR
jgi:ketosteroid isomerase-like protein